MKKPRKSKIRYLLFLGILAILTTTVIFHKNAILLAYIEATARQRLSEMLGPDATFADISGDPLCRLVITEVCIPPSQKLPLHKQCTIRKLVVEFDAMSYLIGKKEWLKNIHASGINAALDIGVLQTITDAQEHRKIESDIPLPAFLEVSDVTIELTAGWSSEENRQKERPAAKLKTEIPYLLVIPASGTTPTFVSISLQNFHVKTADFEKVLQTVETTIAIDSARKSIRGTFLTSDLEVPSFTVSVDISDQQLAQIPFEVRARAFRGFVLANAIYQKDRKPMISGRLLVSELDAASVARTFGDQTDISGTAGGVASFGVDEFSPDAIRADVKIALRDLAFKDIKCEEFESSLSFSDAKVTLDHFRLSAYGCLAEGSGTIDLDRNFDLDVFAFARDISTLQPLHKRSDLQGSAEFDGRITGNPEEFTVSGTLRGTSIAAENLAFINVNASGNISFPSRRVIVTNAEMFATEKGLAAKFSAELDFMEGGDLEAEISRCAFTFRRKHFEIVAPFTISREGDLLKTSTISVMASRVVQEIENGNDSIEIHNSNLGTEAGGHILNRTSPHCFTLNCVVTYDIAKSYFTTQINCSEVELNSIADFLELDENLRGKITLDGSGEGTLDSPRFVIAFNLDELVWDDIEIPTAVASIAYADGILNIKEVRATRGNESVSASGIIPLNLALNASIERLTVEELFPDGNISLEIVAQAIDPVPYLPADLRENVRGTVDMHCNVSGTLRAPVLSGRAVLPNLLFKLMAERLPDAPDFSKPEDITVRFNYRDGLLGIEPTEIETPLGYAEVEGTVPINLSVIPIEQNRVPDSGLAVDVTLHHVDFESLLSLLRPEGQSSSPVGDVSSPAIQPDTPDQAAPQVIIKDIRGQASAQISITGSLRSPVFRGRAQLANGLVLLESPFPNLEDVNFVLEYDGEKLSVLEARATAGAETLTISGQAAISPSGVGDYHFSMSGRRILLASDDTIRLRSDIGLTLKGHGTHATLNGFVTPTLFGYYKEMHLDMDAPPPPPPSIPGIPEMEWVKLDVTVKGTQGLMISNNLIATPLAVDIHIGGSLAMPVISGHLAARRGSITLPTADFRIKHAVIRFPGEPGAKPEVELSAETDVGLTRIYLTAVGPVDAPVMELISEPPHTQEDLLTLVAFGTTRERLKRGGAINLASWQFVRWLKKSTFGPRIPGEKPPSIFERLALETEFKAGAYDEPIIRAEYRMGSRWSLHTEKDQYGDFNFDLQYKIKFK